MAGIPSDYLCNKVGNMTQTISYSRGNPTNWYNGGTYTSLTWEKGR